jgi:allose kinase
LQWLRSEKYPETPIGDLFTVMEETDEYADTLAVTVAAAVQLFDPDAIVMGGGVTAMKAFPLELFKLKLYEHTMKPYPAETLNVISAAGLREEIPTGVLGAMIYARNLYAARA